MAFPGGAANEHAAIAPNPDGHPMERFADAAPAKRGVARAVVADAARFGGTIKIVDLDAVPSMELLGHFRREGRACRDYQAQTRRFDDAVESSQRMQHGGHGGEGGDIVFLDELQDLAREKCLRAYDRGSMQEQRHHKIAESVRVTERNDGQIAIRGANAHRADDVLAVGPQVGCRAENGFQVTGRARGEFDAAGLRGGTLGDAAHGFALRFRRKQRVERERCGTNILNGQERRKPDCAVGLADGNDTAVQRDGKLLGFHRKSGTRPRAAGVGVNDDSFFGVARCGGLP